ncbi:hypothetical protein BWQ96_06639 [Gracilariopsis chorda]|uniref:Uncharacterized protein n=1 Tax=Gracilariopsis chorda TaxID=448386 RepID=A0A2V3IR45_9FLOR|nr:hypothetical protein BWQ96_06639 [Gracilariopsis chorda]|eukprot:PXF43630.1 hypothetical protein BWQ96_06639 [Gracilariopsis chorda]
MSASVAGKTTVRDFAAEQVNYFRKFPNPRNQGSVIVRAVALFKGKLENWIPELRMEMELQDASILQPSATREPDTSVASPRTSRLSTARSVPVRQGGSKPPTPPSRGALSAEIGTPAVGSDQSSAARRSTRRQSSRCSSAGATSSDLGRSTKRRNIRKKKSEVILTVATVQRLRTYEPDVFFNFFKKKTCSSCSGKGFKNPIWT